MRIAVTGATGLIGSHLVERLVSEGHEVHGISTGTSKNTPIVESVCIFHTVDLQDKAATLAVFEEIRPEVVYHLAANAAEARGQFSPIDMTSRNLLMSMNVFTGCIRAQVKKILYASSIAVYGTLQPPFKESDDPKPQDIYGINKLATEKALRVLAKVHGFEYVIFRPHNVYGPRQDMNDPYRNVVMLFMNKLLHREPYAIYGDGSMRRCFSFVDDVVETFILALYERVSGMTFNVGADQSYSIKELSDAIQKVSERTIPPKFLTDRPQDVHRAESDHTLAKVLFGYKDTPLEEGLKRTWTWANMLGPQEAIFTAPEIESVVMPQNWRK